MYMYQTMSWHLFPSRIVAIKGAKQLILFEQGDIMYRKKMVITAAQGTQVTSNPIFILLIVTG